jgi:citrate lyase subunit beta/citryl-CoA lyase
MMRSLLFVPGDSERKMAKAAGAGADALILDLEDSVSQSRKTDARQTVASFLNAADRSAGTPWLIVRINALDTGMSDDDLAAVIAAAPDAVLLPKAGSGADIQHLSARIAVHEAEAGLEDGKIKIHALMTETAKACFPQAPSPPSQSGFRRWPGARRIWPRTSAPRPTRMKAVPTPMCSAWPEP